MSEIIVIDTNIIVSALISKNYENPQITSQKYWRFR
jgi:predicted nucleic acid-binding protein